MSVNPIVYFIFSIVGTIAFAISGAIVGIRRNMDVFGVCVLGATTACGGGIIRDIIIGIVPTSLINPIYVGVSIVISLIVFFIMYFFHDSISKSKYTNIYDNIIMAMDSVGLGVFTVMGVQTGIAAGFIENTFLLVFLGTITGVCGGLLRDMMASKTPYIFSEDIYAGASILGAISCVYLHKYFGEVVALLLATTVVVFIRYLAKRLNLNLLRIKISS
ncbi:MAG: trimeric intracellular cation channel family protein [Lachnospirales bacterium]